MRQPGEAGNLFPDFLRLQKEFPRLQQEAGSWLPGRKLFCREFPDFPRKPRFWYRGSRKRSRAGVFFRLRELLCWNRALKLLQKEPKPFLREPARWRRVPRH